MLINTKPRKAILLSLIAFLSFLGCSKDEPSPTLGMLTSSMQEPVSSDLASKSGVSTSSTGLSINFLSDGYAYSVNSSQKVVGRYCGLAYLWLKSGEGKSLGCLGEPEYSIASDINDIGQIVGTSWEPTTTMLRAVQWSEKGEMVNLGTSDGEDWTPENAFSIGFGINNRGEIVGCTNNIAFRWKNNSGIVLLGSLFGESSAAYDINDNGMIVGTSGTSCCPGIYHATLWTDKEEMLDLGALSNHSQALGINIRGMVVGGSSENFTYPHERIGGDFEIGFDQSCVPFIWTEKNRISQLPSLTEGGAGCANAINDLGQVVGWSYTSQGQVHAFVWTSKKGIKDLGTLIGDDESVAYGINNLGQVVGYSKKSAEAPIHAVMWTVK